MKTDSLIRKSSGIWGVLMLAVLTLAVLAPHAGAQSRDLFNNFNNAGVVTGPALAPLFGVGAPAQITELVTYHWNNQRGATPGWISLRSSTGQEFKFSARGQAGQGGVANVTWVATPNVTIPAGLYTVLDSDPNTRSYNAQSGNRSFAIVRGSLQTVAAAPKPQPPAPQPAPTFNTCPRTLPNCTCRGAGCTHPDLTAFGGDGPSGAGPSVHRTFNPSALYAKWDLAPYTSVATLQSYCTQNFRGRLVLTDDEPWYYFYSGYYAKFGCAR